MAKRRLMSGMRPTGKLHIGHLLGALNNWKKLQDEYECYFEVADWHALTTGYRSTQEIPGNVREMVLDWLACGIDPEKSTIYVQSHVPEIAELHLLFSMTVPVAWLERIPTYKDQLQELYKQRIEQKTEHAVAQVGLDETIEKVVDAVYKIGSADPQRAREEAAKLKEMEYLSTYGFLGYPLLQTADILVMKGEAVPVGQDQLPHLEFSREFVRRFHFIYGKEIFPEPEALLTEAPFVPGIDGRKMSKSYNNSILISDSPEEILGKMKKAITDPEKIRKGDPGHPEICNVFFYHRFFSPGGIVQTVERDCKTGALGCVDDKNQMAKILSDHLAPIRERRAKFSSDGKGVEEILQEGAKKARKTASKTLEEVKYLMSLA